ncbi:DUF2490 domain-containing protein [Neolewinella lacunae]|uniref:DUF2490 domain-containing protein n=1 Tax=Neolewinella lacunae TaxID=1517758 RepID=A0A923PSC6_9BACT|nr:DUF2490 domain-containing protein [Neolewinella lacunae]MBC6996604.1 DUF2490 domain-containing protein [Neolewinella lacunae]MDN3634832.1 DUF2490 domain-containing protein [Neolewinella lacunae]
MKNLLLNLFFLLAILPLRGQSVSQTNAWYMYFGNHQLTDKLALHTEYQWRRSGLISEWQQSLLRVGLDVKVADKTTVTGGYGWIVSYPYGEQPIPLRFGEHRLFEQLALSGGAGRFGFHHRYRIEQRWLENVSLDAAGERVHEGYRFKNRARYRFLITYPLGKPKLQDHTFFLAAYDEIFLGFGNGIVKNILDQNRLYGALGYRFTKDLNVQLGYLNHRVIKADGERQENNHTLQTALTYNLDFRRKE